MKIWIRSVLAFAVLAVALPASANLVSDGGFELSPPNQDFSASWATWGNSPSFTCSPINIGCPGLAPYSGNYAAGFGQENTPGGIEQTLSTVIGQSYTLSFVLSNNAGEVGPTFSAWIGSTANPLISYNNPNVVFPYTSWIYESATFTATSTSSLLGFSFINNPAYWELDNVSVNPNTAVPEPPVLPLFALGFLAMVFLGRRRFAR